MNSQTFRMILLVILGAEQRSSFVAPGHIWMTDMRNRRMHRDNNTTQKIQGLTKCARDCPRSCSVEHHAPGKKTKVRVYKILVSSSLEMNSRSTSTERTHDSQNTRPCHKYLVRQRKRSITHNT